MPHGKLMIYFHKSAAVQYISYMLPGIVFITFLFENKP